MITDAERQALEWADNSDWIEVEDNPTRSENVMKILATAVRRLEAENERLREVCPLSKNGMCQDIAAIEKERDELRETVAWDVERINELQAAFKQATLDVGKLRAWEEEQLAVEASWDVQAVGKLIGVNLGEAIRPQIAPAISELRERLKAAEEAGTSINLLTQLGLLFCFWPRKNEQPTWAGYVRAEGVKYWGRGDTLEEAIAAACAKHYECPECGSAVPRGMTCHHNL